MLDKLKNLFKKKRVLEVPKVKEPTIENSPKPSLEQLELLQQKLELAKDFENIKKIQDKFKGTVVYDVNLTVRPEIHSGEIIYHIFYKSKYIGTIDEDQTDVKSIVLNAKGMFHQLCPVLKGHYYNHTGKNISSGLHQVQEVFTDPETDTKIYLLKRLSDQTLCSISHENLILNSKLVVCQG